MMSGQHQKIVARGASMGGRHRRTTYPLVERKVAKYSPRGSLEGLTPMQRLAQDLDNNVPGHVS